MTIKSIKSSVTKKKKKSEVRIIIETWKINLKLNEVRISILNIFSIKKSANMN